jgi:predicted metal-binding membrane protein
MTQQGSVSATTLEQALSRDRLIVMIGLGAVVGLSAFYTVMGFGMSMSAVEMTWMALKMPGMEMASMSWTASHALLIFLMWWLMMIAMMVPSAAPTVLLYARLVRERKRTRAPYGAASAFLAGYLIVWAVFSLGAMALQWSFVAAGSMSGMMELTYRPLAAALLIGGGLYQLSPLKNACLRHCQHPLVFLMHNWKPGMAGALRMGIRNGWFCLGCCWVLMALLFVGGIMNLLWIAGLAIFVGMEKLAADRPWLTKISALALLGFGLVIALR